MATPPNQEPVLSAPQAPKKAPISIMPSRAMFTTPLRSENIPPSAAKVRGVAQRNVAAINADQTKTPSRLAACACVARTAQPTATSAPTTAPPPTRRSPRVNAQMPAAIAQIASSTGSRTDRTVTGGSATHRAMMSSTIPAIPIERGATSRSHDVRPR
jgi:hypothetical protein